MQLIGCSICSGRHTSTSHTHTICRNCVSLDVQNANARWSWQWSHVTCFSCLGHSHFWAQSCESCVIASKSQRVVWKLCDGCQKASLASLASGRNNLLFVLRSFRPGTSSWPIKAELFLLESVSFRGALHVTIKSCWNLWTLVNIEQCGPLERYVAHSAEISFRQRFKVGSRSSNLCSLNFHRFFTSCWLLHFTL